ncbi:hypothetical protein ACJIZ3_012561 [Penstemon smallii]|uniref:Uncharacterized protein n=1 Tax=Penstemon smallii TaxID=265156 RepID=A0ABD3UMD8_9LAMI
MPDKRAYLSNDSFKEELLRFDPSAPNENLLIPSSAYCKASSDSSCSLIGSCSSEDSS